MKILNSLILFLFVFVFSALKSQINNTDSLFLEAKHHAEKEKYELAIQEVKQLILAYPENLDYQLYLARLYFWNMDYDSALKLILPLTEKNTSMQEAFKILVQIELSAGKLEELLTYCEKGISLFSTDADFFKFYKAQGLEKRNRDKEAIVVLDEIGKEAELYKDAQYLRSQILNKQKNAVSGSYLNTTFSHPGFAPWHLAQVQYLRKTSKSAYIARVNYGVLFGITALQVEADAYPKLGKRSYLYLNTGFSDGKSVFPLLRLGGEFYHGYKAYTASLGVRYLNFTSEEVIMFTGHVGMNMKNFRVAYRPFLVHQYKDWFPSHILNFRKSFEHKEGYIQLDLQYGGMPYYFFSVNEFSRISAYRIGLDCKFRIKDNFFVQPILMYELEEFVPDQFRNRYNVQVILTKRF